ncbi:uncharacterized protein [Lolium perenne]|uniref:uncharacterized protein isoform X2 n=1 Tax=Lolium perenne TaxID=4522 RepID=UPI003A99C960
MVWSADLAGSLDYGFACASGQVLNEISLWWFNMTGHIDFQLCEVESSLQTTNQRVGGGRWVLQLPGRQGEPGLTSLVLGLLWHRECFQVNSYV